MTEIKEYYFKPLPIASDFFYSETRVNLCVCGNQSGKTHTALGGKLIRSAWLQPGFWQRDIDEGDTFRILVLEPTNSMTKLISWKRIYNALPKNRIIRSNECEFILFKGYYGITEIIFKSYEMGSERVEGLPYYEIYADECFQMNEQFFSQLIIRSAARNGILNLIGTPKPTKFLLDIIEKWYLGKLEEFAFFTWKTEDNSYYSRKALEFARQTLPAKIFKREFEASLDVFEGQIYDNFNEKIHVQEFEFDKNKYKNIVAGQDWGYTHFGVLLIVGITHDDSVDIIDEFAINKTPVIQPSTDFEAETWIKIAKNAYKKYNFNLCFAGPDEPEHIDMYRFADVPTQPANNSVSPGIQFVFSLMHIDKNGHTRYRIHPRCTNLIREKKLYKWDKKKDGEELEKPLKINDDSCDAERYAIFSAKSVFNLSLNIC